MRMRHSPMFGPTFAPSRLYALRTEWAPEVVPRYCCLQRAVSDPCRHRSASCGWMLDRLLKTHRGGGSLVVSNDEAHHCYTLQGVDLTEAAVDVDENEETKRAELWFGALRSRYSVVQACRA